jgi:hypothetical protein
MEIKNDKSMAKKIWRQDMKTKNQEPVTVHSKDSNWEIQEIPVVYNALKNINEHYNTIGAPKKTHQKPDEHCPPNDRLARDLKISSGDLKKYLFEDKEIPADVAGRIKHLHSIKLKDVDMKKAELVRTCDINVEVILSLSDISLINIGLESIAQDYDIRPVKNALDAGLTKVIEKMGDDIILSNGIELFNVKKIYRGE